MRKKLLSMFLASIFCLCGLGMLAGCGEEDLPTEEGLPTIYERLDNKQRQVSYRSGSMVRRNITTAYENGWLTQTDLMYAMYYARGKVYTISETNWMNNNMDAIEEIDFLPEDECPELAVQVEMDIKKCYYDQMIFDKTLTFEEFAQNISFRFVGSYDGTFVITEVNTIYWSQNTGISPPIYIAGLVWNKAGARDLTVLRYD